MNTLKEVFIALAKEEKAHWRDTKSGEEQLLLNGKGVLVGTGKQATAIYKSNLKEYASYECVEEAELYRLKRVTTKVVDAAEAEGYFQEPEPTKKTRKGP